VTTEGNVETSWCWFRDIVWCEI